MNRLLNILMLRGRQSDVDDRKYSLAERLGGRHAAVINYGPYGVKVGRLGFTGGEGRIDMVETHTGLRDMSKIVELLHARTDCNAVVVGIGTRIRSALNELHEEHAEPVESPGLYFEDKPDPSTLQQSLPTGGRRVFETTTATNDARDLERALKSSGLTVMREQMTSSAILNALVPFVTRHSSSPERLALLLVADQGSITGVLLRGSQWIAARGAPIGYLNPTHPTSEETDHIKDFIGGLLDRAEGSPVKIGYFDSEVPVTFETIRSAVFATLSPAPEVLKWEDDEFPNLDLDAICFA